MSPHPSLHYVPVGDGNAFRLDARSRFLGEHVQDADINDPKSKPGCVRPQGRVNQPPTKPERSMPQSFDRKGYEDRVFQP